MGRTAREEVTHTVAAESGRLRRGSAVAVLALLSASALVPVVVGVTGGGTVATALAGVAGNVGSGYLTGVIERVAARLRRGNAGLPLPGSETVRDALAADLLAALEKSDSTAQALSAELTTLLMKIDGFEAAVNAAKDDLRTHLLACFEQLVEQQRAALKTLGVIDAEQRRQGRQLRYQTGLHEEVVDRLRWLTERLSATQPSPPLSGEAQQVTSIVVTPAVMTAALSAAVWHGGAEVVIDGRVYLLHADLLEERFFCDHCLLYRQARGLRLVPAGGSGDGHVWLRQVEVRRDIPAARIALEALGRERELLARLGSSRGLPRVNQFAVTAGRAATLVVVWPTCQSTGAPCESLDVFLDRNGTPIDPWRLFRLCTGLAGLCDTLAILHDHGVAHRYLTPAGIITLADGRLVLRDLGLAARDHEPGEGPAEYQAPEQRRRGKGRSGPKTDVYQLAAVAYHLIAGRPPSAGIPLPLRAQAHDVPERIGRAVDAALAPDSAERPDIRSLGATLRAACDDLS